ncbi:MAG: tail fiber protein [Clostridium sp.]|nr:tail fiber protein [Clostridium sp.]
MATSNTTPVVIPQPIAAQATSENINSIPNGATGTNRASFQEGFPAITRMPVIENPLPTQVSGLPPKQQDFNGLFNAVSQHNFFAQNGGLYSFNQAVSDAIGGYPQGALLWAIVGGKPSAVYSLVENNTFNFLTNPEYLDGVHWAFIDAGLPTGTIITWGANDAPDGYLICNGAAISRTTYARLFNVIGTTWGEGDGNTTFNLPNFVDRFLRCATNVGTYINQGLPEISGAFNFPTGWGSSMEASGAFTYASLGMSGNFAGGGAIGVAAQFTFSAKRSNSIYGASTDVMPSAATITAYIRY